jgi:hypothetical protein
MSKHALLALAALVLTGVSTASAQNLTASQARAIIAPWSSLFNVATRGDVKSIQEQVLTPDYEFAPGTFPANAGAAKRRSKWSATSPTPFPT